VVSTTSAQVPELLTPRQVAELTGQHLATVYRCLKTSRYPSLRVGRNALRVPIDGLVNVLLLGSYENILRRASAELDGAQQQLNAVTERIFALRRNQEKYSNG
jgi:hypothetical protein